MERMTSITEPWDTFLITSHVLAKMLPVTAERKAEEITK